MILYHHVGQNSEPGGPGLGQAEVGYALSNQETRKPGRKTLGDVESNILNSSQL
jgi:hypothetical protein